MAKGIDACNQNNGRQFKHVLGTININLCFTLIEMCLMTYKVNCFIFGNSYN
jgi:hypothetical protein